MPAPTLNPEGLPRLPDWPGARVFCSTRTGGVSKAPCDSLNLGSHVGDDPSDVAVNRQRLAEAWGAKPVFLNQVHGTALIQLDDHTPDHQEADACWTQQPGVACTIMVADCLPVLLAEPEGQWVAAAHAGWRGLAGETGLGVMEVAVNAMRERMGSSVEQLRVWLGPCIGPQAFEVGQEVRDAFCGVDAQAIQCYQPGPMKGKWWADLP